jgi:hypothetical protein
MKWGSGAYPIRGVAMEKKLVTTNVAEFNSVAAASIDEIRRDQWCSLG